MTPASRLNGAIATLKPDRSGGTIQLASDDRTVKFTAKQLQGLTPDDLYVGLPVTFWLGRGWRGVTYANDIQADLTAGAAPDAPAPQPNAQTEPTASPPPAPSLGTVQTIAAQRGRILPDGETEAIAFVAREVQTPGGIATLRVGDRVSFTIGTSPKSGKRYANAIAKRESSSPPSTPAPTPTPRATEASAPPYQATARPAPRDRQQFTGSALAASVLQPCRQIACVSDWREFEDCTFLLLRLLGIHALYQFPRDDQAGQADGAFLFGKLAVICDCTLRQPFEQKKDQQIRNYVLQLGETDLRFELRSPNRRDPVRKRIDLEGTERQVWIITQGRTHLLLDDRGVKVKEVAVQDLVVLLEQRLTSGMDESELERCLQWIEEG